MKSKILFISLLISFLLVSCENAHNFGYPRKVTFEKEGGSKICSGSSSFYAFEITDYNGNNHTKTTNGENDTIIDTYDWLSVKYINIYSANYKAKFKLGALPNTTGRKRTLYLSVWVNDSFADIKVTQH